jgi:hypothetical protein
MFGNVFLSIVYHNSREHKQRCRTIVLILMQTILYSVSPARYSNDGASDVDSLSLSGSGERSSRSGGGGGAVRVRRRRRLRHSCMFL